MATLIFIAFFLVVFHFVLEAVILPNFRLNMRYKYFALRDELIALKCDKKIADDTFRYVHSMINTSIAIMADFDLGSFVMIKQKIAKDDSARKSIAKRVKRIESAQEPRVKEIYNEIGKLGLKVIAANSSGLVIYLLPLAIIVGAVIGIEYLMIRVERILLTPKSRLSNMVSLDEGPDLYPNEKIELI